jgi:two-component system chemotaxis response regulator CheY
MKTILIADDNPIFRQVIEVALRGKAYLVQCANDGRAALDMMEAQTPDLLLLDVAMPVLDGMAVLRAIRADARWQDLPVILVTAMTERDCRGREPNLPVQGCLTKSHFSLSQVLQTVQSLIGAPENRCE